MKLRWFLLSIFCSFPLVSNAEIFADSSGISGKSYFGVHYSFLNYEREGGFDAQHQALGLRVGHEFIDYLGVEGQFLGGLRDDDIAGYRFGVDYLAGAYVRGNMFLWDSRARLYGLLGMAYGKSSGSQFGISTSSTDTGLSYGMGVEFYGDSRNAVSLELMRYLDGEDNGVNFDIDAFNIGYIHRFDF